MITFIIVILFILLVVLPICFPQILPLTLPFLLLIFLAFVIKVRRQCKKYGTRNVFRMSYSGREIRMQDYVYMMLNEIPTDHHIKKWNDLFIYVDLSGIYLFCCFENPGMVTGDISDQQLLCSFGKTQSYVKNPLLDFQEKIAYLEDTLNEEICSYLVIPNNCQFFVKDHVISTLFLKNVYYDMVQHKTRKYSEADVENIMHQIDAKV